MEKIYLVILHNIIKQMDSLLKLDQWTLALFLGICFLLLFMLIFKFKLVSNVIAENFAESCGYGAPNHNN